MSGAPQPVLDATMSALSSTPPEPAATVIGLLSSHAHVFVTAFVVALLATPLVRRLAVSAGVIDRPDSARKAHQWPVASLGGLAVFAGVIVALAVSFVTWNGVVYDSVPIAIVIGIVAITFTGLADDIWGWDPRLKIAGQLVAAAALAIEEVGVKVAAGALAPVAAWLDPLLGTDHLAFVVTLPWGEVTIDLIYWIGTAIIAAFVLGGCNAANLIDGLDGLLSGVVAVVALGLLAISLLMVPEIAPDVLETGERSLAGARIVLCLALLGAVLGFLPHNFNPATIFLGDCGSLLLGYLCVVIILTFGELGQTHLVFAGLIVFAVPIVDTALAIIRRWIAGTPMSAADDQHIHHQLKRSLGGVKRAVFTLYGISFAFATVGVTLAALVLRTGLRVRVIYALTLVLFSFIAVIAVKAAVSRRRLDAEGALATKRAAQKTRPEPGTKKRSSPRASAARGKAR
jgi:UDP-GlcNAc:undecaprenyl-phosphate GlcNAc-1-phosphate transferase